MNDVSSESDGEGEMGMDGEAFLRLPDYDKLSVCQIFVYEAKELGREGEFFSIPMSFQVKKQTRMSRVAKPC